MSVRIMEGDCRAVLKTLPEQSVHCVVTSPPYFGLRDYGVDGQIGLEANPEAFVAEMVDVFRGVHRVLRDDGTLWLNLGDSYANDTKWGGRTSGKHVKANHGDTGIGRRRQNTGLKSKDLIGIPWRVAFALQADGWYLRRDIIWHKLNPMPESVRDRPSTAHEYLFLLTKQPSYYYDAEAIVEPVSPNTHARLSQDVAAQVGSARANGGKKTNGPMKAVGRGPKTTEAGSGIKNNESFAAAVCLPVTHRNKRSVWSVATEAFSEAHFATFPPALIEPCIKAGCPEDGTVLDPFGGAGTTGLVADRLQRNAILIELNPAYAEMARARLSKDGGMFAEVA
ncbi:MAG: site-specific DNA-methyltransferase [Mesorhizobium sp.]|uniref:DNA-methyltransferase n=1 Tax=Mesorhizobium sp. TaxID=1871066 RepID=UPI00120BA350|nr:site-specific DNA-methyltransferase [Mesorhizobium sp.]TIV83824.1 MAG: site-specific DNA-methyltransferase [Mesorhizobium sp.]